MASLVWQQWILGGGHTLCGADARLNILGLENLFKKCPSNRDLEVHEICLTRQVLARELQGKVIYPNDDSWQCSKQWSLPKVHWVLWSFYWSCNIFPRNIKLSFIGFGSCSPHIFASACWWYIWRLLPSHLFAGDLSHSHHGVCGTATLDVRQSGWRLHRFLFSMACFSASSGVMWEELATTSTYKIIFCWKSRLP